MLEEIPCRVQRFQTDNGIEFTAYPVQDLLAAYSIKFRPIRPRLPLNGKLARAQRTVLTECFATLDNTLQTLPHLAEALAAWQPDFNWFRIHGPLGKPPQDKRHDRSPQTPFGDEVIDHYDAASERQLMLQSLEKTLIQLKSGLPITQLSQPLLV